MISHDYERGLDDEEGVALLLDMVHEQNQDDPDSLRRYYDGFAQAVAAGWVCEALTHHGLKPNGQNIGEAFRAAASSNKLALSSHRITEIAAGAGELPTLGEVFSALASIGFRPAGITPITVNRISN